MKDMKKKLNSKVIGWVRKGLPFYLFTLLPLFVRQHNKFISFRDKRAAIAA